MKSMIRNPASNLSCFKIPQISSITHAWNAENTKEYVNMDKNAMHTGTKKKLSAKCERCSLLWNNWYVEESLT